MLLVGLFYLLFPCLMIAILYFKKQPDFLTWLLGCLVTGVAILFLWTIARWEIVSIYLRPIFPVLYLLVVYLSYKKINRKKLLDKKLSYKINLGLNFIILFFMGVMSWLALRGYRIPATTIAISSPFKESQSIILNGGSRPMINPHFHVTPQNYAVDIVGLNSIGMRAISIDGGNRLENYQIYGRSIYSPVEGQVILVVDEFDDLPPPATDKENITGNHLLIKFGDNELLLAHLKKGSIRVKEGDWVDNNTLIAQVGNSGNTSEPHLHMHIETGGEANKVLNGKGVPFTINGQFLLRGDVF